MPPLLVCKRGTFGVFGIWGSGGPSAKVQITELCLKAANCLKLIKIELTSTVPNGWDLG